MKFIKYSLLLLFITAISSIQAQILSEQKTTEIIVSNPDLLDSYQKKIIEHKYQLLKFEKEDQGELNQNIADTPVHVSKEILIDQDNDGDYDKQYRLFYNRDENKLAYQTTQNALLIINEDNTAQKITQEGVYEIDTDQVENIIVKVNIF